MDSGAKDPAAAPDVTRQPYGYHLSLCPSQPEPPFQDAAELERVWGRRWGASDEVGRLRSVLVRAPRGEWDVVRADAWNEAAGALVDPGGMWYWESREPPDRERVAAQHRGLVSALRAEGVEVVFVEGDGPAHLTRPIYTRDPLLTVPGGAIIGRMAPAMRRGEEPLVSLAVAAAGMPILRTITGTGLVEGGSFVKLRPTVAAYGTSFRCNEEGARQLRDALADLGIELIVVPMVGWSIHLDGHLGMLSPEAALVEVNALRTGSSIGCERWGSSPCPARRARSGRSTRSRSRPGGSSCATAIPAPASCSSGAAWRSSPSRTTRSRRAAAASTARRWNWCAIRPELPASMPKLTRQCRTGVDTG